MDKPEQQINHFSEMDVWDAILAITNMPQAATPPPPPPAPRRRQRSAPAPEPTPAPEPIPTTWPPDPSRDDELPSGWANRPSRRAIMNALQVLDEIWEKSGRDRTLQSRLSFDLSDLKPEDYLPKPETDADRARRWHYRAHDDTPEDFEPKPETEEQALLRQERQAFITNGLRVLAQASLVSTDRYIASHEVPFLDCDSPTVTLQAGDIDGHPALRVYGLRLKGPRQERITPPPQVETDTTVPPWQEAVTPAPQTDAPARTLLTAAQQPTACIEEGHAVDEKARAQLPTLTVDELSHRTGDIVAHLSGSTVITQDGKPTAVLVPYAAFQEVARALPLLDTISNQVQKLKRVVSQQAKE